MRQLALFIIRTSVLLFKMGNKLLPAKRFPDQPFLGIAKCSKCGEEWTIFSPCTSDISPEAELVCPNCAYERAQIV